MATEQQEKTVKLVTGDGTVVDAPAHLLAYSGLMKGMCDENGEMPDMVPLPNAKPGALKAALTIMAMVHKQPMGAIKKPIVDNNLEKSVDHPGCVAFATALPTGQVIETMLLANYMDFSDVLNLMAARLATELRGLTPAQIREKYNIENDFTEEEEKKIVEENRWCDV
jgi:S-phase kinase-associated protein 1